MPSKVGANQHGVLHGLSEYGPWSVANSWWNWGSVGNTERVLKSLVKRGFVICKDGEYSLTDEGRALSVHHSLQTER